MDFEKLGSFYLGKEYDLDQGRLLDRLVMYDARDLTTHAVCLGMTGSGKTGLCIDLLEEAAIDRVPALIIDPKGDITNLLLQFPELRPEDFLPWVNPDDARRKGLSVEEHAGAQAELWRNGLGEWGQSGARIRMLQDTADFRIYTPGSESGIPVSVLQSFACPKLDWDVEAEILRERIEGTVSALLGLIGVNADPLRSREHILISNILEYFWRQGTDLNFQKLILAIQKPPLDRLGVFDIDTFFPPQDRFELAMLLNNILASPGFASWIHGEPLDIGNFLAGEDGRIRHSIFYIAHLTEAERHFFVTMLLNSLIGWMRGQPGTSSLRAIVYMDEIFGFFPPIASPPSKKPMLTLLKQARAFGIGMVLATQNPVDLDYKGLSNAGTWFIGRLQTDRDRQRVLDGLLGASAGGGTAEGRRELSNLISALGNRVFLLHDVHRDVPTVFQTRWAMSYLRGPLTRTQVADLVRSRTEPDVRASSRSPVPVPVTDPGPGPGLGRPAPVHKPETLPGLLAGYAIQPPSLAPGIRQSFLVPSVSAAAARLEAESDAASEAGDSRTGLLYRPGVLARGSVSFFDQKRNVDERENFLLFLGVSQLECLPDWSEAFELEDRSSEAVRPESEAHFERLPAFVNESNELNRVSRDLADHLYRNRRLQLFYSPTLREYSRPGESRREFTMRLTQVAREARDQEVDKLTSRYEKKIDQFQDRLRTAELALSKKEAEESARKRELLVSVGESILGMFMGRRSLRAASSSMSKYRVKNSAEMARESAEGKVETLRGDISQVEQELKDETEKITRQWEAAAGETEEVQVAPRRTDVRIDDLSVGWAPHWVIGMRSGDGSSRERIVRAFSLKKAEEPRMRFTGPAT